MLCVGVMADANGELPLEEAHKALEQAVEQVRSTEKHARMQFLQRSRYEDGMLASIQLTKALEGTRSSLMELRQAAAEKFLLLATSQACAQDCPGETAIHCVHILSTAAMTLLRRLLLSGACKDVWAHHAKSKQVCDEAERITSARFHVD